MSLCVLGAQEPSGGADAPDVLEAFKRILGKFATAEQVTGSAPIVDSDEDEQQVRAAGGRTARTRVHFGMWVDPQWPKAGMVHARLHMPRLVG